jgi:hypothetical protein
MPGLSGISGDTDVSVPGFSTISFGRERCCLPNGAEINNQNQMQWAILSIHRNININYYNKA